MMEHKEPPPPYPYPAPGYTQDLKLNPPQMGLYPPQPVFDGAPPPAVFQPAVQPGVTLVQPPSQPTIIQTEVQPGVMVLHPTPGPTIIQSEVQSGVVLVTPVVVQPRLGEVPGQLKCSFCQCDVVTVTRGINGALTWIIFGGLCIFGIWPFCLIPFCCKSCQDIEHSCPNCHNVIYIYRRM